MDRSQRATNAMANNPHGNNASQEGRLSSVFENQRLNQQQKSKTGHDSSKFNQMAGGGSTGGSTGMMQSSYHKMKGSQQEMGQQPQSSFQNQSQQMIFNDAAFEGSQGKYQGQIPQQYFESPAGPSSIQGHPMGSNGQQQHMMNMTPSSMGGGASSGLNLMMPKTFQQQQQQHNMNSSSLHDPNIDVHGRFQIQRSISNQNQNIINSKGGHNVPSSGPAHSMGASMSMGYNQSKGRMQQQNHGGQHNSKGRQDMAYQQNQQSYTAMGLGSGPQINMIDNDYSGVNQEESNLEENFSQLSVNQQQQPMHSSNHERYQMRGQHQSNEYGGSSGTYNNQQMARSGDMHGGAANMSSLQDDPQSIMNPQSIVQPQSYYQPQQQQQQQPMMMKSTNQNQMSKKPLQQHQQSSQIDSILQQFAQYSEGQLQQLFVMHSNPYKQDKLILTEAQFNLIRNVYPQAIRGGRWNLSDDQQLKQTFINLYNIYEKVYLAKGRKKH